MKQLLTVAMAVLLGGCVRYMSDMSDMSDHPGTDQGASRPVGQGAQARGRPVTGVEQPTPVPGPSLTQGCAPASVGALLGPAADFAVFVLGDLDQSNGEIGGRLAVGGHAELVSYTVGAALPNSQGSRDDLIVGGNLSYFGGSVPNGNAVYGLSASIVGVGFPNGGARLASPLDFAGAAASLRQASLGLAQLQATGATLVQGGHVLLQGSGAALELFALDGAALSQASTLEISTAVGATVIVNVSGQQITLSAMSFILEGPGPRQVLLNLHQAEELAIHAVDVRASLLAPGARVELHDGDVGGSLVVQQLGGFGQSHGQPFAGCTPLALPQHAR